MRELKVEEGMRKCNIVESRESKIRITFLKR